MLFMKLAVRMSTRVRDTQYATMLTYLLSNSGSPTEVSIPGPRRDLGTSPGAAPARHRYNICSHFNLCG